MGHIEYQGNPHAHIHAHTHAHSHALTHAHAHMEWDWEPGRGWGVEGQRRGKDVPLSSTGVCSDDDPMIVR